MRLIHAMILFALLMVPITQIARLVAQDHSDCVESAVGRDYWWSPGRCFIEYKPNVYLRQQDFNYEQHLFH